MNDIKEVLHDFCEENGVNISSIKDDVIQSLDLVDCALNITEQNITSISLSKMKDDLLLSISAPELTTIISRYFSQATVNAKCYDVYNTGYGIKLIITYENAFKD